MAYAGITQGAIEWFASTGKQACSASAVNLIAVSNPIAVPNRRAFLRIVDVTSDQSAHIVIGTTANANVYDGNELTLNSSTFGNTATCNLTALYGNATTNITINNPNPVFDFLILPNFNNPTPMTLSVELLPGYTAYLTITQQIAGNATAYMGLTY
jgi:hypothetical protein